MGEKENRRGFLKTIPATIILVLSFALWSFAVENDDGMITIVMAKDSASFVGGVVDQEVVQNMVDALIFELTGVIDDPPLAYECLFPMVTDSTKILIKYNPKTPETTRKPMIDALKKGLTYMLKWSFPAENITVVGEIVDKGGRGDTIVVDSSGANLKYAIKEVYSNTDYIIYCPSAWGTDIGCGVDMCLSLMMSSIEGVGEAKIEDLYPFFHDTTSPALSILNYHPTFNGDDGKTCLYLLDILSFSGTGSADDLKPGYAIYATKNITVCDWKGIRFLKDTAGVIDSLHEWQAQKVCSLSVVPIDLGVVNEGQMLEVPLRPPWTPVGVLPNGSMTIHSYNVRVTTSPARTVFSVPKLAGDNAAVTIYNILGRKIWTSRSSEKNIVWNHTDLNGNKVPGGVFIYQFTTGEVKAQGKATIKR